MYPKLHNALDYIILGIALGSALIMHDTNMAIAGVIIYLITNKTTQK